MKEEATTPSPAPEKKASPGRAPLPWPWALGIFAGLLILPIWVAIDLSERVDWSILVTYAALISLLASLFYWSDKRKAKADGMRVPENILHLMEFLAGWPSSHSVSSATRPRSGVIRSSFGSSS